VVDVIDPAKAQQRLSQEMLFTEMRTYGKMSNILVDAKKESAVVTFASTGGAISARNVTWLW
jgi:hypothetical protein